MCGFANGSGGIIYVGKNDRGQVVHLENYLSLMESIPNKIRDLMGIICDVQWHEEGSDKYISIKVNPYSVAISLCGRYYFRSGNTNVELTGAELNEFLLKKAGKTWDDVIEEGASMADIDESSILKFVQDSKEKGRLPETQGLSNFELLEKLNLTEGPKLKRAAIVMFGKNPSRFYPSVKVKIGRFGVDSTDLRFHEIVEGNLVYTLEAVLQQLFNKFLIHLVSFEGFYRVEKPEYPIDALREMLLNALVHRTYMGAPIQMRVFDDRLTIWNEGGLPIGLSLEGLKGEHSSRPRNLKIADACFMAGYIDTWGRGIYKIFKSCSDHGLSVPEVKEMNSGIQVTLSKVKIDQGGLGDGLGDGLVESQVKILNLIKNNAKISIPELSKIVGISTRSIEKNLQTLKNKGMITREGNNKTGYWKIILKK